MDVNQRAQRDALRQEALASGYQTDTSAWEDWQRDYRLGLILIMPPHNVSRQIDPIREQCDPKAFAVCPTHISLSDPLRRELTPESVGEIRDILSRIEPFTLHYDNPQASTKHAGVAYPITPQKPIDHLVEALHSASVFEGQTYGRRGIPAHMTIAEFISIEDSLTLCAALQDSAPSGSFMCDRLEYIVPDRDFRFQRRGTFYLGVADRTEELPHLLGVRSGTVALRTHSDTWASDFESECEMITALLGSLAVDIQHIGSTAVPGLDAKPVIDIAIAVASIDDCEPCIEPLGKLGFGYIGDRGDRGGHIFAKYHNLDVLTHTIHLVEVESEQWRDYLAFRDFLRTNQAARRRYADQKRELLQIPGIDHRSYTYKKAPLARNLLAEALAAADQ